MVKSVLAAAILILLGATSAQADKGGAFTWNGFYFGAYLGGAWGDVDIQTDAGVFTPTSYSRVATLTRAGRSSSSP